MLVNKKIGAAITAIIDPYFFYNSLKDKFDNVSYFNPYDKNYIGKSKELTDKYNSLNGVLIKNCLECEILECIKDVNEVIKLNIDMYLFTERCVVFDLNYSFQKQHELILEKIDTIAQEEIKIKKNGNISKIIISQYVFNKLLVNTLFKLDDKENSITKIISEDDPFDTYYNSSNVSHDKTKKMLGLDTDIYGSAFAGASITVRESDSLNILDDNKFFDLKDLKQISKKYHIYSNKEKKFYITDNEDLFFKKHIPNISKYFLYKTIVESYSGDFINGWFSSLEQTSKLIIDNLDNNNEVFWKKLRTDIEKSQLRFLSSNIRFNKILSQIKKLGYNHIYDQDFRDKMVKSIEEKISSTKEDIKEIKYGLDNIATPGHTHDEQLLQQVTEKGNERILLLSFLAMSIPMIGAILSPNLEMQTKLISALVLTLLPCFFNAS